jgi:ABC-type antimicrobial peptide transport system permease subunit
MSLVGIAKARTSHSNPGLMVLAALIPALAGAILLASLSLRAVQRFTAITDRARDLGILTALGTPASWIHTLWLQETTLIALPGTLIGAALTILVASALAHTPPDLLTFRVRYAWFPIAVAIVASCDLLGAFVSTIFILQRDVLDVLTAEE